MNDEYLKMMVGLSFWKNKTPKGEEYLSSKLNDNVKILIVKYKDRAGERSPTHFVQLERKLVSDSGEERVVGFPTGLNLWERQTKQEVPQTYFYGNLTQTTKVELWPTRVKSKENSPDYYVSISQKKNSTNPGTPASTPTQYEPAMAGAEAPGELIPF